MNETRRLGRFRISTKTIDCAPKAVLAALSGLIVVRAESLFYAGVIEYVAIGEVFDEISCYSEVPSYECTIKDLVGGKYHVTFTKA